MSSVSPTRLSAMSHLQQNGELEMLKQQEYAPVAMFEQGLCYLLEWEYSSAPVTEILLFTFTGGGARKHLAVDDM